MIPKVAHLQIKALVIRHQRATEAREIAAAEILQHFKQANIDCIALKGLALAYSIYPSASLRPMRDIDLLVHSDQALTAQQSLRDLGYSAENRKDGAMYNHHHLPVAMKVIDGMNMSIEIHHNALSGDVAQSISYADLTDPPLSVSIGEHITNRLGHTDTLRHLCHHSFEPALRIKLGSLHDVVRYATFYQQEINWDDIRVHYPFVINTLRCIHFVIALPQTLLAQIDLPTSAAPAQAGEGYQPLSYTLAQYRGIRRWQHIFHAPAWWAHVFYQVPPEQSLFWVKWLRHPLQIISLAQSKILGHITCKAGLRYLIINLLHFADHSLRSELLQI